MLRVCGMNPVTRILYLSGILDHPGIQYEPCILYLTLENPLICLQDSL